MMANQNIKNSFRYGFLLDPRPDDEATDDIHEAEDKARQLSVDNSGHPVAVWDQMDNTIRLYDGYEEFVKVPL